MTDALGQGSFLAGPETSAAVQRLYDDDVGQVGFVMNASRLWGHQPAVHDTLFELLGETARAAGLTYRQRGVLVAACAATMGDSYCSLAWGSRLAGEAGAEAAAAVLRGDDSLLDPSERVLARWARRVVDRPNDTTDRDVDALREAGWDEAQVVALTAFVALRAAFSTVNDALGAQPDRALADAAPAEVVAAVRYGRPVESQGTPTG